MVMHSGRETSCSRSRCRDELPDPRIPGPARPVRHAHARELMLQSATQMNATKRIEGSMTFGGWVVRGAGRAALALLVAAPAAAQQETTAGVRSYTEARAVLDRGIAAVGGLESVR